MRLRSERGFFILLSAMTVLSGMLVIGAVGMGRSTTELLAANRHVEKLQAFHLAEAGLDDALSALKTSAGGGGVPPGWAVLTPPACPVSQAPCWGKTVAGSYTALITKADQPLSTVRSIGGSAGGALQTVEAVAEQVAPFPKLDAALLTIASTQVAWEFWRPSGSPNASWLVDGHDACTAGVTNDLWGVSTKLSTHAVEAEAEAVSKGVTGRIQGKPGDIGLTASIHSRGEPAADPASDPAVRDILQFIAAVCNAPSAVQFNPGGTSTLSNKVWGTPGSPQITCVNTTRSDATLKVTLSNVSGAGILVIKGNLNLPLGKAFAYNGLVVVYGKSVEFDWSSNGTITGGVVVADSETGGFIPEIELGNDSDAGAAAPYRQLLYNHCEVDNALALAKSATGDLVDSTGGRKIVIWQMP